MVAANIVLIIIGRMREQVDRRSVATRKIVLVVALSREQPQNPTWFNDNNMSIMAAVATGALAPEESTG